MGGLLVLSVSLLVAWLRTGIPLDPASETTVPGVVVRASRPLMGTVFRLSTWVPVDREREAATALAGALDAIAALEREISSWDAESETSAVNRAGGQPVRVGEHLRELVGLSLRWAQRTGGAFDPTAGRLFELWGLAREAGELPEDSVLRSALAGVGHEGVVVDRGTVRLPDARAKLGFGAIGKGFAADHGGRVLRAHGLDAFVIDAGGDLLVSGSRGGEPWRIGVRHPRRSGFLAVLHSTDCAVATSGDYEQFVALDGNRYSHVIDPRTGWPVNELISVTVIAEHAADADALATAVSVLGVDAGLELIRSLDGVEVVIVNDRGSVTLSDGVSIDGDELRLRRATGAV